MFKHLPNSKPVVTIHVNGQQIEAKSGDTVSAALLIAGVVPFRNTPVSGDPRAPYCGMGVCFECLVKIDGLDNRQACLILVCEGMQIETQTKTRSNFMETT